MNKDEILILVKSKKILKKIDRKTGESSGSIDLIKKFNKQDNEINFSYLQMDINQSTFLVKDNIKETIYIFDKNFKFIFKCDKFDFYRVFKTIEFTLFNDGYYCDHLNKKIYFF